MKKLRKISFNAANILSQVELASIDGGLLIFAYDYCTIYTANKPCVYKGRNSLTCFIGKLQFG